MSERAFFVIIREGNPKTYYDRWGGMACVRNLLKGSDGATAIAENHLEMDCLMPPHADGGYLVDYDSRTLIVIGCTEPHPIAFPELAWPDDQLSEDSKAARVARLFRLLAPSWQGWMLCYDHRNTQGFAAYLHGRGFEITPVPRSDGEERLVPNPFYAHGCMEYLQA